MELSGDNISNRIPGVIARFTAYLTIQINNEHIALTMAVRLTNEKGMRNNCTRSMSHLRLGILSACIDPSDQGFGTLSLSVLGYMHIRHESQDVSYHPR